MSIILDDLQTLTNALERRCKAKARSGERCRARVVNAAGFCVAHDPERPVDYRALGRKSGEARRKPNPERVHEDLREYLRREVPPERVWQALEAAMLGNNESARVSASRVLMDALHEPEREVTPADHEAESEAARARLDKHLLYVVERVLRALFLTGEPARNDPVIVGHTLELIHSDERLGPIVARLAAERGVERDEALARLAGFTA